MPQKYPQSFRDRAIRLVTERLEDDDRPSPYQAIGEVAPKLGIANETLRRWVNQAQVDSGERPGVSSDERSEIRRLKRENAELRRANEILKTASVNSTGQCNTIENVLGGVVWRRLGDRGWPWNHDSR